MLKTSIIPTQLITVCLSSLSLLLASCGGSDADKFVPTSLENSPGGHYFGYYVETDDTNDPAVGAMYLDIPSSEGNVKGRMSFQYADCQRSNALEIKAKKLLREINLGTASGTIDSVSGQVPNNVVNFSFRGGYSRNLKIYSGQYNLLDGAQGNRSEKDCISYTLSDKGNWTVYPSQTTFPSSFEVIKDSSLLFWNNAPATAHTALINIIDTAALGTSSNNGFVLQRVITPLTAPSTVLSNDLLQADKQYIVLVQLFDSNNQIVAHSTVKLSGTVMVSAQP